MSDDQQTVECSIHGEACATFVCVHLLNDPHQHWHCVYPSEDNRWPDAWCDACDRFFQEEGEWNENNEDNLEIKLLCHFCYEARLGSSVEPQMRARGAEWQSLVTRASAELQHKQDEVEAEFALSKQDRWDWNAERKELVFSKAGKPTLIAPALTAGSISSVSNTWLWSWANHQIDPSSIEPILRVRAFGETEKLACLTVPKWPADEVDGWEMTAVAAQVLGARGAYRLPGETGWTYMLLQDMKRVPLSPLGRFRRMLSE